MTLPKSLYGARFLPVESITSIRDPFTEGRKVRVAGRLMGHRVMGKSAFGDLKDQGARIQIFAKKDDLGEEAYSCFKGLTAGDILGVEGELFYSKSGEPTVRISHFELLSKIVRSLPEKWHGLKDIETRYRHRYVDLIVNDDVRKTFVTRSRILRDIRRFLDDKGFMEVETPMMQSIPGGAMARPFVTHHNTLDIDLYLRVAPELYLKRLLVGGFEKVYEVNRNFRNEGISTRHNPEFTMLELYQAYADYHDMMDITEELMNGLVTALHGREDIPYGDKTLNFKRPWKRLRFYDALKEKTGVDFQAMSAREAAAKAGFNFGPGATDVDILDEVFGDKVEATLMDPTFILDYPAVMSPLAKAREDDPSLTYRFELFISGMELANAFSELNDPHDQRRRFTEQKAAIGEHKVIDEDFLMALEYAMPPAGGLGIGIDRLVMLLTNQPSIRDVVLFPQMRPEKNQGAQTGPIDGEADLVKEEDSREI